MTLIRTRRLIEVNTDPQRRCYNGCHFSSAQVWTPWATLERWPGTSPERIEARLEFWRGLNEYAVKARGEVNTLCEFRAAPDSEDPEQGTSTCTT